MLVWAIPVCRMDEQVTEDRSPMDGPGHDIVSSELLLDVYIALLSKPPLPLFCQVLLQAST